MLVKFVHSLHSVGWSLQNNWQSFKTCFPSDFLVHFPLKLSEKCHLAPIGSEKSSAHQRSPAELLIDAGLRLAPGGSRGPRGRQQTDGMEDGEGHWDGRAASGGLKAAELLIDTRAMWSRAGRKTKRKDVFCTETIPECFLWLNGASFLMWCEQISTSLIRSALTGEGRCFRETADKQ